MKANEWKLKLDELKLVVDRAVNKLPWCGDLALQKVVYLLESVYGVKLGYEFGYHHMGPYSFDLADDLSVGAQSGEWSRQSKQIPNTRYWVNQYEVIGAAEVDGEESQRLASALDNLLAQFTEHNQRADGRTFELVATIHYLRNVQEVPEEELEAVLRGLKPKYSSDEFKEGVRQLGLLEKAAEEFGKA